MIRRASLWALLPMFALVTGCLASLPERNASSSEPAKKPKKVVTGNAPAFELTTLEGTKLSSAEIYGDKPVFISLWATWCGPCVAEAPVVNELYGQYGEQVQFIAISVDGPGDLGKIQSFVSSRGVKYPIAHDTTGTYGNVFKADYIPKVVMIDLEGNIVHEDSGFPGPDALKSKFREAFKL